MIKYSFLVFALLNIGLTTSLASQEHEENVIHHENNEDHKKHLISASINHTIIFSGIKDNNSSSSSLSLPSFGLNYTYWFNHTWAIGLHNDIIIEDFVVKETNSGNARSSGEAEETVGIERGTPISSVIVGLYKPWPFLGIMAGVGREFSSHEDFTVVRFGLEFPYHLPHNWELFGVLSYDININAYKSLTYGIGIGKMF